MFLALNKHLIYYRCYFQYYIGSIMHFKFDTVVDCAMRISKYLKAHFFIILREKTALLNATETHRLL